MVQIYEEKRKCSDIYNLCVYNNGGDSDSCGGQNKNSMIVSLWLYLILIGQFDRIEHKFLLPGHTYLPVDSDFGVIEKRINHSARVHDK